jgi:hypothetical protein
MTTAKDVADWMFSRLTASSYLDQEDAVWKIEQQFGKQFVYENANGNPAIDKKVLAEFRKLTTGKAVWERGERSWRLLRPGEKYEGRQVD